MWACFTFVSKLHPIRLLQTSTFKVKTSYGLVKCAVQELTCISAAGFGLSRSVEGHRKEQPCVKGRSGVSCSFPEARTATSNRLYHYSVCSKCFVKFCKVSVSNNPP